MPCEPLARTPALLSAFVAAESPAVGLVSFVPVRQFPATIKKNYL